MLSSDEDRIDKSPNLFGCDFQCIQKGLGFLFEFHIFFVYHFIPLLPDGNRLFCGSQFFFQTLVVNIGDNAIDRIAFECVAFIRCQRDIVSECGFFAIASMSCTVSAMVFAALVSFCKDSSFFFCFAVAALASSKLCSACATCRPQFPAAAVLPAP